MSDRPLIPSPLRTGIPPGLVSKRITEIDITVDLQALALQARHGDDDDETTPTATPRSGSPAPVVVTPPGFSTFTMFSDRPRQSSEATITPATERPRLRRKAHTAPSGSLRDVPGARGSFTPQPPRRAVSSTTAEAFSRSGSRQRRRPSKEQSLTPSELSQPGLQASRSLLSKKKTSKRNSGARMGLRSKPLVWRMTSPPKPYELPPELKPSFSSKQRVRDALRARKVDTLRVELDAVAVLPSNDSGGLLVPRTPAPSIVPTPSAFYKRAGSVRTKTPPSPATSATSLRNIGHVNSTVAPLGNNGMRSAPLRVVAAPRSSSLPKTPLRSSATSSSAGPSTSGTWSKRAKHFSLPLSPVAQRVPWRRSIVVDGDPEWVATPVPGKRRRPVYIPGPIQLEENTAVTPRRDSTTNLERFDDGTVHEAKRYSDLVALEGIVMYFEDLGVAEEASQGCLDQFWLHSNSNDNSNSPPTGSDARTKSPRKAATRAPTVPPPPVPSPPSSGGIATTFEGIFRTQRTLRDDDDGDGLEAKLPPSPGTPGRRKPLLRQLLRSSRKSG